MLDLSYFQRRGADVQTFTTKGAWQTWIKPRSAKLVNILCIGAGGGGGSGNYKNSVNRVRAIRSF